MGIGIRQGCQIRRFQLFRTEAARSLTWTAQITAPQQDCTWPMDARLALFALEAGADLAGETDRDAEDPAEIACSLRRYPASQRPRRAARHACRVRARLLPLTETPAGGAASAPSSSSSSPASATRAAIPIYLRDLDDTCAGFICDEPLEAGAAVWFTLPSAVAESIGSAIARPPVAAAATVCRCRPFMDGWYEGVLRLGPIAPATNVGQPLLEVLRVAG